MDIGDLDLTIDEQRRVAANLNCDPNRLDEAMTPFAAAAAEEYARMILGQQVVRSPELREFRLHLLLKHVFKAVPAAARVGEVFRLSESQSKSLLRNTLSRYHRELEEITHRSVTAALARATPHPAGQPTAHRMIIDSVALVEVMNAHLAGLDKPYDRVRLVSGSANAYETKPSSVTALRAKFR